MTTVQLELPPRIWGFTSETSGYDYVQWGNSDTFF